MGAVVISSLRERPETAELTMRDVYECRTVRRLAERAAGVTDADESILPSREDVDTPFVVGHSLMLAWLLGGVCVGGAMAYLLGFVVLPLCLEHVSIIPLLVGLFVLRSILSLLWLPFSVAIALGFKHVLIGRYQAGRHPVWGQMYVRHWLVKQAVRRIPWALIAGTEFQCMALRALGARIRGFISIRGPLSRRWMGPLSIEDG